MPKKLTKPILMEVAGFKIRSLNITNGALHNEEVKKVIRYCGRCGQIAILKTEAYESPIGSDAYYHNPKDRVCGGKLRIKAKLRGKQSKERYYQTSLLDSRPRPKSELICK